MQVLGRFVAAQGSGRERLYAGPTGNFGVPCERDFAKLNLRLSILEQPDKNDQQRANGLDVGGRE